MTTAFDPAINFGLVTVLTGYTAADTLISLVAGDGLRLPDPTVLGDYNVTWWDATSYSNPSQDPKREVVRVTNNALDVLTVTRAQEGTAASTKNDALKTYMMSLSFTKKTYDDITTAINGINPSVWLPMETITFSGTSASQTTADFANASTAKEYLILVDLKVDYTGGLSGMGIQINGETGGGSYVAGQTQYEGTAGAANTSSFWRLLLWTENNTKMNGQVIIGAQEGPSNKFIITSDLVTSEVGGRVGSKGYALAGAVDNYVKNITFMGNNGDNMTGTFSIFQRQ